MSTSISPRRKARITGLIYLSYFLTAILGEVFMSRAGVSGFGLSGDAAATANNLLAHQASYQLGFALNLISIASYAALMALLYQLFKFVNKTVSLLALSFGFVGLAVQASISIFDLAPFVLLGGDHYLSVFSLAQLQSLSLMFLNLSAQASGIELLFFGLFLILTGYLIFKSTFLPRIIGVLNVLAGFAWFTFLSPQLANAWSSYIEIIGIVAEASLMLWLLIAGVNEGRWMERRNGREGHN